MKNKARLIIILIFVILSTACSQDVEKPDELQQENSHKGELEEIPENSEDEIVEQVLNINWRQEPPDLDPQLTIDQVSFSVINSVYEGLVRLNPDGSIGEGLADYWEISDDGTEYIFHLRDAQWSDGTAITAEDFAYAWLRTLNPKSYSLYSYQLYYIENAEAYNNGLIKDPNEVGIEVIDEKTLKVKLVRETPFFLSLTSFITYIPAQKQAVEEWGDSFATEAKKMIYSGPFIIKEWIHDEKLILEKNPNYWDSEKVKLDRIEGVMLRDNNTIIEMYDDGELDIAKVPSEFLKIYKDSPEYHSLSQAVTWYLQFNTQDPWFNNYKLRKAFALATDSQTYVDAIQGGMGIVAEGYTPPAMKGVDGKTFGETRNSELPDYRPEEAGKLFLEALEELEITKEEFEEKVTFLVGDGDTWSKIAQFFQSQWEYAFDIKINIESLKYKSLLGRYQTGEYKITYSGWIGDYNDPLTFMDVWVTNNGNNTSFYSNPEYDEAVKKAVTETGDARYEAMAEAEAILAEDLPIYPMYHPSRNFVQKSYVKDIARYPVGANYDFKWAFIE